MTHEDLERQQFDQWARDNTGDGRLFSSGVSAASAPFFFAIWRGGFQEQKPEIDRLRADLISCRGTVKTEANHYERLAMVHGKTPHGATYEAEAQRLSALLDRIDGLAA